MTVFYKLINMTNEEDYTFNLLEKGTNKTIAEVNIFNNVDCYVIRIQETEEVFKINNLKDISIEALKQLKILINAKTIELSTDKHVLLLDDGMMSRLGAKDSLEKVPRYCGWYLIKREEN